MKKPKTTKLRIIFMGTSHLAEEVLTNLLENKFNIVGVFTKPDSKVGRKKEIVPPRVKTIAQENEIPVFQPQKLDDKIISEIKKSKPDIIIVASYGKIIPKEILEIPGFGALNVHPSLLPKYRGPAPVQNAILNGETKTGVSIIAMDEKVDAGDILKQKSTTIKANETSVILGERLYKVGSEMLIEVIPSWIEGKIDAQEQDEEKATFCQLIERQDGKIIWSEEAFEIYNRYRALQPWPGVFTFWNRNGDAMRIKLLEIELLNTNPPSRCCSGEVVKIGEKIGVQTSKGVIIIKKVQTEGKKPMEISEFVNGYKEFVSAVLS